MRLATTTQSRRIDERAQKEHGLSAELLMEGAGAASASAISNHYPVEIARGKIAIVCGTGHNGGDGLVVARWLCSAGQRNISVFLAGRIEDCAALTRRQAERLERAGVAIHSFGGSKNSVPWNEFSLIVDALFGIGLSRPVEGEFAGIIESINSSRKPVVSLDVPSGLDADRGCVLGRAIRAQLTLTFGLAKPGFFVREGPAHAGRVLVLPISFPRSIQWDEANSHFLFGHQAARRSLPSRSRNSNKSKHGHTVVIAGSAGKWGAAILASRAAYRAGSGYVTLASFEDPAHAIEESPEILTATAEDLEIDTKHAYCVGPGLGHSDKIKVLIERLLKAGCERVVLDADAISTIAQEPGLKFPASWILTPHAGELARIMKVSAGELDSDPFGWAQKASLQTGAAVLFKGYHSILATRAKSLVINAGNAALAKAGTGDVLTGLIGGFMAQGLESKRAAALAAYVHGRAADDWLRTNRDIRTLIASDVLESVPSTMRQISEGSLR